MECPQDTCTGRIVCRSESSGRIDDNASSVKKRFDTFEAETLPNLDNLSSFTKIIRVNSNQTKDEVFDCICKEFQTNLSHYF